ncbi:MAG: 6-carboxytetrahydropterin synthase QueD [Treponema sp.]|nr:6-carboxytetrahydropterin synthase QueD [Treponema sp.]
MFEVRVTADFAAAHFLKDYNGKCENLHGHNYKVYAHVRGSVLNEGGMLMDFSKLKGALRQVCKQLDHTNLNDLAVFDNNPSAERIAMYIYDGIVSLLKNEGIDLSYTPGKQEAVLFAVDVFETETSRARYCVTSS